MSDIELPRYLMGNAIELGLKLEEIGVAVTLVGFADNVNYTFDKAIEEMSTHGAKEERLSTFQIRKIIKKLENEKILKVIKNKKCYSINWLPKAFEE